MLIYLLSICYLHIRNKLVQRIFDSRLVQLCKLTTFAISHRNLNASRVNSVWSRFIPCDQLYVTFHRYCQYAHIDPRPVDSTFVGQGCKIRNTCLCREFSSFNSSTSIEKLRKYQPFFFYRKYQPYQNDLLENDPKSY